MNFFTSLLIVIAAFALFAWIPCTMVIVSRKKRRLRLDERLEKANRRYARGELRDLDAHSKEIDEILAEDWERL